MDSVRKSLEGMRDLSNQDFVRRLIPTVAPEKILGIRTPVLRSYAKTLFREESETVKAFLKELPHHYLEENHLHGFLIEQFRDLDEVFRHMEVFLPYIDNWATCDTFAPKIFKKYPKEVYEKILTWLDSKHPYTIRYGIGLLLSNYLEEGFVPEHLHLVAGISSEEYYVNMMIAWYFSTALVKQYEQAIVFFEKPVLSVWVHNKSIQKAVESRRISDSRKAYLKTLRCSTR